LAAGCHVFAGARSHLFLLPLRIPPESTQKFGLRICTRDHLNGFGVDAGFLECFLVPWKSV
jgi:hypothetical protein